MTVYVNNITINSGVEFSLPLTILDNLLNHDPFCVFADFSDYLDAQDRVSSAWVNRDAWNRMSLLNTARSGFFSSDRSIRDYCKSIWGINI